MNKNIKIILFTLILVLIALLAVACSANPINLTLDANGGKFENDVSTNTIITDDESAIIMPNNPTKEGYSFGGWFFDKDVWKQPFISDSLIDASINNNTIFARWYTVISFESNGGSEVDPIFEDIGIQINAPFQPSRIGYVFGGWYSDSNLTQEYIFSTMPTESITLFAAWVSEGLSYILINDDTEYAVAKGSNRYSTGISIPRYYNGKLITKISDNGFKDCVNLETIYIPDSVISIGKFAFDNCESLINITIPSNVTTIGWYAFSNCSTLIDIIIPSNVTSIGTYAFYNCDSIESVNIPAGIVSIGEGFFWNCTSLKSIIIPSSVTILEWNSFYNCTSLTDITFEENSQLTSIGYCAFYNCRNLNNIVIFNSITNIGAEAFNKCNNLTSVIFEENSQITEIKDYTFNECKKLSSITIPANIISIGSYAFYYCNSLSNIIFEENCQLESIGDGAFGYCSKLEGITFPDNVTIIGDNAFCNCISLDEITIPEKVTSIGTYTFIDCSGLENVSISDDVSIIGYGSFMRCRKLTSISIPDSVVEIKAGAFYDCTNLTLISISDSIRSIEIDAFNNTAWYDNQTDGLIYVGKVIYKYKGNMPSNTNIELLPDTNVIAERAFADCSGLTSMTIPNSMISIGDYAFAGCMNLYSIIIPNNVTILGKNILTGCSSIHTLTAPFTAPYNTSNNSFLRYYFGGTSDWQGGAVPSSLKTLIITEGTTAIGVNAFKNCVSLENLTIPSSVTSIGDQAFENCSSLANIIIPDSVISIGVAAFLNTAWYNNQADGLIYAGKIVYAYKGDMPLNTNLTLIEGTTGIAGGAFFGVTNLASIIIPESVMSIGRMAFMFCNNLLSVTVENENIPSLGDWAFNNTHSNLKVYVPIGSVNDYKIENGWNQYSNKIYAIEN